MNITIKSLPDHVGEALREAAVRSHRSLNSEIIHRLSQSLGNSPPESISQISESSPEAVADAWASLAGRWKSDMSVEAEISSLYELRTGGRDGDVTW